MTKLESAFDLAGKHVRFAAEVAIAEDYHLLTDRKEERDVAAYNSWVADPAVRIIGDLEASFRKYPPIKLGTPDPYTPPEPVSRQ
jgi:hypothetical protein